MNHAYFAASTLLYSGCGPGTTRCLLLQVERPEFAQYLSGSKLLPGAEPLAHCYCGYQFGHFSGQLGDGAAIYLGEVRQLLAICIWQPAPSRAGHVHCTLYKQCPA